MELHIGVRELKNKLSEYLGHVKHGQVVVITEHGKPIGRIIPNTLPWEDRLLGWFGLGWLIGAEKCCRRLNLWR